MFVRLLVGWLVFVGFVLFLADVAIEWGRACVIHILVWCPCDVIRALINSLCSYPYRDTQKAYSGYRAFLFACLFVCLLAACPPVCLSVYMSVCLSVCLSKAFCLFDL